MNTLNLPPRRKVVSSCKTGPWNSNYYLVELSCGHRGVLTLGVKGAAPKTVGCSRCLKENKR